MKEIKGGGVLVNPDFRRPAVLRALLRAFSEPGAGGLEDEGRVADLERERESRRREER